MNGGDVSMKEIMSIFRMNSIVSFELKHNLKVDALSASFFALAGGALYPFLAAIAISMGAGPLGVGLLVAAPFAAQLFTIYWGHLCQNRKKLPFIVFPGIAARLLLFPLAFISSPAIFVSLIILHHMFLAITWPAFTSLVQKIYPITSRGSMMGLVKFVFGIFYIVAVAGAGRNIDNFGHRWVFIVAAIAGITASLIFRKIREPEEGKETAICRRFSHRESFSIFKKFPAFKWFVLGMTCFELGKFMVQPYLPLYWMNELSLNNSSIGVIAIIVTLFWFLASPLWGIMVDRLHPIWVIISGAGLYTLVPLIYITAPNWSGVLLAASFTGLGMAAYEVGWSNNLLRLGGNQAGKFIGIYLSLVGLRGLLGPIVGSTILSWGSPAPLLLISVLLLAGSFPVLIHSHRVSKGQAGNEAEEILTVEVAN